MKAVNISLQPYRPNIKYIIPSARLSSFFKDFDKSGYSDCHNWADLVGNDVISMQKHMDSTSVSWLVNSIRLGQLT